jgi:hypothetical protein
MESIQELAADFLVAHSLLRDAVSEVQMPDKWDFSLELSNVVTDFDHMLRMMTSQALRMKRRVNDFNKKAAAQGIAKSSVQQTEGRLAETEQNNNGVQSPLDPNAMSNG